MSFAIRLSQREFHSSVPPYQGGAVCGSMVGKNSSSHGIINRLIPSKPGTAIECHMILWGSIALSPAGMGLDSWFRVGDGPQLSSILVKLFSIYQRHVRHSLGSALQRRLELWAMLEVYIIYHNRCYSAIRLGDEYVTRYWRQWASGIPGVQKEEVPSYQ
ncbi:uncharacterized protein EI90DRAFT_3089730 [Cantharellus anzutake]|uniref:uncharacterized protein n=1 Tax=Cantharellus anzutake TaxID=1750568 RepID=UPI001906FA23|nr:uncharacterized protein EI90DRAFT_3089730 [Cantharellus anzutake]KAF8314626.1 hypothetical protein EI90DRAFT_3089730 [Cantharellus anzutake]